MAGARRHWHNRSSHQLPGREVIGSLLDGEVRGRPTTKRCALARFLFCAVECQTTVLMWHPYRLTAEPKTACPSHIGAAVHFRQVGQRQGSRVGQTAGRSNSRSTARDGCHPFVAVEQLSPLMVRDTINNRDWYSGNLLCCHHGSPTRWSRLSLRDGTQTALRSHATTGWSDRRVVVGAACSYRPGLTRWTACCRIGAQGSHQQPCRSALHVLAA